MELRDVDWRGAQRALHQVLDRRVRLGHFRMLRVSSEAPTATGCMMAPPLEVPPKGLSMTAETEIAPLTVLDAARACREAHDRVTRCQSSYASWRRGWNRIATTRARTDWGLAVLEWIEASVTLAEAEDRRDPSRAAMTSPLSKVSGVMSPGQEQCGRAWRDYQEVRKAGNMTAIESARTRWREEFVLWFQALAVRCATEDEQRIEDMRDRQNDEMHLDPAEAFDPLKTTKAGELRRASKERVRQESIRRDQKRDHGRLNGWRPAGL